MSNLGFGEIVVIVIVALLIFGPAKLPKIGRAAGQALHEFKKGMNGALGEEKDKEQERK